MDSTIYIRRLMVKSIILFILLFNGLFIHAQVKENFDDGDFSSNPVWSGTTGLYQINGNKQLQTNGTTGTSGEVAYLSTPNTSFSNMEWKFWVKFNLSPSTQNFCRFYISSDQQDLSGNLNGYYVQLGGSTGNTDSISLYKQSGPNRIKIIAGRTSTVSKTTNVCSIKVLRDSNGVWQLLSDTSGGNNFISEGSTTDNQFTTSSYTGIYCRYTATNVTNFYWDDITIQSTIDKTPPILSSLNVISVNQLELIFDEVLDANSSKALGNYSVDKSIGSPSNIIFDNQKTVTLTFANNFSIGVLYTLSLTNIKDIASNTISTITKTFIYSTQNAKPVLINEIFADPSPKVGLPDYEFIELYNPNNFAIDITNWTLTDGSTSGTFLNTFGTPYIPADSYVIVCSNAALPDYSQLGIVVPISSFPSINNAGDQLVLKNANGTIISDVNFTDKWYNDNTKAQGGWTIERISTLTKCDGKHNWSASVNSNGGTPGRANSIVNNTLDVTAPEISTIYYEDSTFIVVVFSEPITTSSLSSSVIAISNGISIQSKYLSSSYDTLFLKLNNAMQNQTTYYMQIQGLSDCEGNTKNFTQFIKYLEYKTATFNDIIIDEIYSNPLPNTPLPNVEWIELKNRASNPIIIKDWSITDGSVRSKIPFLVLMPDSFIILCNQSNVSKMQAFAKVLGLSTFPSLNNDGDQLMLSDANEHIIYNVTYKSAWYGNTLKDKGGWSLEMIDTENPCMQDGNWKPCISQMGGTPGKTNSVNGANPDLIRPQIKRVHFSSTNSLVVHFSETIDSTSIILDSVVIENWLFVPSTVHSYLNDYSTYEFVYPDSFLTNKVYKIQIFGAHDCNGNRLYEDALTFMRPLTLNPGNVVINEVLFNPKPNCIDFVELYNASNHAVDLKELKLASKKDSIYSGLVDVSIEGYLLLPGEYVCVSEDEIVVKQCYQTSHPNWFVNISSMPSYSDDEGTVVIINQSLQEVDIFHYNQKMHHLLIDNEEGVSLERVSPLRSTNEPSNWQSAAGMKGYGTPADPNSQLNPNIISDQILGLSPQVFSPDGDGFDDVLNINILFPNSGYAGKLYIYDAYGRLVKSIANWQVFGVNASVSWNGFDDTGERAAVGSYLIVLDYYNQTGTTGQSRKICSLTEKKQ